MGPWPPSSQRAGEGFIDIHQFRNLRADCEGWEGENPFCISPGKTQASTELLPDPASKGCHPTGWDEKVKPRKCL